MRFRQLLADHAAVDLQDLLESLHRVRSQAPQDRPYTIANFVASADGRATIDGRSGPLGDDGDHAMFHGLREQVDAVLAGTGTLRTERYGRILGKPERRERRLQRGMTAEPLACVVTRTGDVPTEIPLFSEPEAHIIVFTPHAVDLDRRTAHVEPVMLDPGLLTLTTAMRILRADYEIELLLCEGGPTLFNALLHEGLIDELFLTLAPKLTGGGHGPTITSGPELGEPKDLRLVWLLERNDSLYLRYALR